MISFPRPFGRLTPPRDGAVSDLVPAITHWRAVFPIFLCFDESTELPRGPGRTWDEPTFTFFMILHDFYAFLCPPSLLSVFPPIDSNHACLFVHSCLCFRSGSALASHAPCCYITMTFSARLDDLLFGLVFAACINSGSDETGNQGGCSPDSSEGL